MSNVGISKYLGNFTDQLVGKSGSKLVPQKITAGVAKKSSPLLVTETVKLSQQALSKGALGRAIALKLRPAPVNVIKEVNAIYQKRSPALVALKYQAMSEGAFPFYRATNYLFFADVATDKSLTSKVKIPIQGDLHLENIGTYKTAKGEIAYDLNDFDDAITGPYTWDLARMATSIRLAATENGLSSKEGDKLVEEFVEDYLKHLGKVEENPAMLSEPLTKSSHFGEHVEKTVDGIDKDFQEKFLEKITESGKFKRNEKLHSVSPEVRAKVENAIKEYAQSKTGDPDFYKVKDVVFRVAGKGSLGRYRYSALIEGKSSKLKDDLVIELKEATQPAATTVTGELKGNQAERVVEATRYFLPDADPHLGMAQIDGIEFFVREISVNEKVDLSKLNKYDEFKDHVETVAMVIARAHGRSGRIAEIMKDSGGEKALSEKIGSFAKKYEAQVQQDFQEFTESLP